MTISNEVMPTICVPVVHLDPDDDDNDHDEDEDADDYDNYNAAQTMMRMMLQLPSVSQCLENVGFVDYS